MFLYLLAWLPPSDIHFRNTIQERSLNVEGWGVPLPRPALLRPGSYQAIGLFRISPGPDQAHRAISLMICRKPDGGQIRREMRARCASVRRRNCIRNRKEEVSGLWRIISRHASHYCLWSGSPSHQASWLFQHQRRSLGRKCQKVHHGDSGSFTSPPRWSKRLNSTHFLCYGDAEL